MKIFRSFLPVLLLILGLNASASPLIWDKDRLSRIKNDPEYASLREKILSDADGAASAEPLSVVEPNKRFVTDPHYYMSFGTYWWPDPENPDGPYIKKDGQTNPETRKNDYAKIQELTKRLRNLSVAFYLTGEKKYHNAAVKLLKVWFLDKKTYMYPNLEYGQIVPGRHGNKGRSYGLIDIYCFADILDAIELMNDGKKLNKKTYKGLQNWFRDFAQWMQESEIGKKQQSNKNNHGLAYDVTLSRLLLFAGNRSGADRIAAEFRAERLDKHIAADGSQPLELARTRAFTYSVFNLTHIIDFCLMRESIGDTYYADNQEIIDRAISFLLQFDGHEDEFPYQQITGSVQKGVRDAKQQAARLGRLKASHERPFRIDEVAPVNNLPDVLL